MVSFYDLYRYVYQNPELEALAKQRAAGFDEVGKERSLMQKVADTAPWLLTPNAEQMTLPPEWADDLQWVIQLELRCDRGNLGDPLQFTFCDAHL